MVTSRDKKSFGKPKRTHSKSCSDDWHRWCSFFIHVQAFRDPLGGELPHVRIFLNNGPNPLTWDAQFLSYWFSRNPAGCLPTLGREFYGMVTVLIPPGPDASQVEKSPSLNWATQVLTVAYDGACFPNVSVRMAWISFDVLPFRK
jgi:hypothetical protein